MRAQFFGFALAIATAGILSGKPQPSSASFGVGILDALRRERAAEFSLDVRFRSRSALQPRFVGTWATEGSRFVGAGWLLHATSENGWDFAVGFAPGYYEREHGHNLGSALEFLSTIEISRPLRHGNRIGMEVGHISNGSIGDKNPGAETLRLFWSAPLGRR